ncbi:MAG: 3-oxoacyl-[acyl-carrier-protein] reductase [Deltaproteobacteria bacterium]|jgi:3-oxoacyl-[acyl-carrier protein] reductase|nr:3-oxoacyl-[acyl-carrier-protein] reductase [Deltaproteobacteria bacterium]
MVAEKVILVTGGTRGIGRAIALAMASEGRAVLITHQNPASPVAAETVDLLRAKGAEAEALLWPVEDGALATAKTAEIVKKYGRLDVLVNNAGVTRDNISLRLSDEDFDRVLRVNLFGAFAMARAAAKPMLKARAGRIINMTSVVAFTGNPGQANYAASKGAIVSLTKTLALEYASRGITVNAVAPGFVNTDLTASLPEAAVEAFRGRIPLGRLGEPGDVAAAVAFLASDEAAYITGQTIHVNGGLYM